MTDEVRTGGARATLTVFARGSVRDDRTTVRLDAKGLSASRALTWEDVHRLARFVDGLEQDWRGWPGTRDFESLESELRVRASHDGSGHVQLDVELSQSVDPLSWRARANVAIEAGEAFTQFASSLRELTELG